MKPYNLKIHPSLFDKAVLLAAQQPEFNTPEAILHLMINKSLDRYLEINHQAERLQNANVGQELANRYLNEEIARLNPRQAEEFLAAYQKEAAINE